MAAQNMRRMELIKIRIKIEAIVSGFEILFAGQSILCSAV